MKRILLTAGLMLAVCIAHSRPEAPSSGQPAAAQAPGQTGLLTGKVIATTNAADYTYIQVDTGTKKVWAAAPRFSVQVGDAVSFDGGMPMPNYHSKTLKRDFDVVYFTERVLVNNAPMTASGLMAGLPPNHPPLPGTPAAGLPPNHPPLPAAPAAGLPPNHPPITSAPLAAASTLDFAGLTKAPDGKTVQEIIANKARLNGQEVKVRGKVVRYNDHIMGRNWLHVRDGTGSEGNNDLLVTTAATAKVGDIVLVTGKVEINKDFGFNYQYAVVIEDAKVVVE